MMCTTTIISFFMIMGGKVINVSFAKDFDLNLSKRF